MATKDFSISEFGTKLMISSKAVNNIPDKYLSLSMNARVQDGSIGPRKGKTKLISSTIGTNNKGGFVMNGKLYQVTNSKIYEVDKTTGEQTEKASLGYDERVDILVYNTKTIITSNGQTPKVFDGTGVTDISTVVLGNSGILEFCRNFSFITKDNVLYASRPITAANPEYAYDWTGTGSQNITYDSKIKGLKSTMNGLYVFTENKIEYLGANSLQNISGSATFISTPLGEGSEPVNNLCIAASGDKIFYLSKNLQIQTVNFIQGASNPSIGELSSRPVVSIKEFLNTIDPEQPTAFAHYSENEKTVNFHVREVGYNFNNLVIVYDLINDTWNIDTGKNYNYIVRDGYIYYGYSDVNSSIYIDDSGYSDNGSPIDFRIETNYLNQDTLNRKIYRGFFTAGSIGQFTALDYEIEIDGRTVFQDSISGNTSGTSEFGEVGGSETGGEPMAGYLTYISKREPFDRVAKEGRIFKQGNKIKLKISSKSDIQDFSIDTLGVRAEVTARVDTSNSF